MSGVQQETDNYVLETTRLVLREATFDDAHFMLQLLTEPAWQKFIGKHEVCDEDGARNHLQERILPGYENGLGFWLVVEKSDNQPAGICGLAKRTYLADIDLGFAFLERYWGSGFAYESATAVIDYAKQQLKLKRLAAITLQENGRSVALLGKLGFSYSDTFIDPEGEEVALYKNNLASRAALNFLKG